jgi:signal transduction histidine kinase
VRGDAASRRVCIAISDDGPGIEPDRIDHIFDPFYTTRSEGTGLGLSIAHQIVSRHGGSIDVETELGTGTTFLIQLPIEPPVGARVAPGSMPRFQEVAAHG